MIKSKFQIIPLENLAAKEKSAIKIGPFGSQLKKSELVSSGIHIIGIENVINENFDGLGDRFITNAKFQTLKSVAVKPGDILITMMGTIGELAVVPEGTSTSIMDSHLLRFRPNTALCDRKYISWAIKCSSAVKQSLDKNARGAIMSGLNSEIIRSLPIPLPPLTEQKRIAAILDKADDIRRKRLQAIQLVEEFLKSIFLDMFGDPVTNPKGFKIKRLDNVLDYITSGSRGWARYYSDSGAKFLRIQNVGRNEILLTDLAHVNAPKGAEAERTRVKSGDILLSITADLGRTGVIYQDIGEAYINQHLAILRVSSAEPIYISAFLASKGGQLQIKKLDRQGVKSGLNFDDIRSLEILDAPAELQRKFAAIWKKVQKHKVRLIEFSLLTDLNFRALSSSAFRGDL
ncbi:Type I restriction-modification system, specificity subunit S [uncultured Desulfobacterium sp.]|uniref:Type I restriction-modification system, specificity subunit S n=1 Tax=uncultured Desulfobacterium sp. TaxID=201089 RepID=A0A445MR81_9BACT|nr:Type I restriction-modification system, specificity subunit S [uncultured Desulfobacterium sp.]